MKTLFSILLALSFGAQAQTLVKPMQGGTGQNWSASSGIPLFTTGAASLLSSTGSGNVVRATSPTLVTPTVGANAASASSITNNAAGGTGQGAYYAIASAGVTKSYFGAYAVIFGGGTDQSLLLHSVADNAILNAASGKTSSLAVNFTNIVAATSTGAAVTGTLQVSSGGSANKAVCWKSGTTLGFCSTVVDAAGACTCN